MSIEILYGQINDLAVILLIGSFNVNSGGTPPGNIMAAITYTTQLLNGILMLVIQK